MNPEKIDPDVLARLHDKLLEHCNEEELRTVCFEMGVEYDDLPAEGRAGKARELISHLHRQERLDEFMSRYPHLCSDAPHPPSHPGDQNEGDSPHIHHGVQIGELKILGCQVRNLAVAFSLVMAFFLVYAYYGLYRPGSGIVVPPLETPWPPGTPVIVANFTPGVPVVTQTPKIVPVTTLRPIATDTPMVVRVTPRIDSPAQDIIERYLKARQEAYRTCDTGPLEQVLSGKALDQQVAFVKQLQVDGCYWDMQMAGSPQYEFLALNESRSPQVRVTTTETRKEYCKGQLVEAESVDRRRYITIYAVEQIKDKWYVIGIDTQ